MKKDDRLPRVWSPETERDLFEIWDYVWSAATAAVADKLLNEIDRVCFVLEAWPEYGKVRDDVREGLRSVSVSRYVVFYRVTKKLSRSCASWMSGGTWTRSSRTRRSEVMGIYSTYVLPRLTHLSMGQAQLRPYRARAIGGAKGRVLEIGIGSGLNLPFYNDAVEEVIGVDPSPEMLVLAERAVAKSHLKVTLLARSAESLPLDARSVDTVVVTWSLCMRLNPAARIRSSVLRFR
jgi:plasmid stabilization system protein ParE